MGQCLKCCRGQRRAERPQEAVPTSQDTEVLDSAPCPTFLATEDTQATSHPNEEPGETKSPVVSKKETEPVQEAPKPRGPKVGAPPPVTNACFELVSSGKHRKDRITSQTEELQAHQSSKPDMDSTSKRPRRRSVSMDEVSKSPNSPASRKQRRIPPSRFNPNLRTSSSNRSLKKGTPKLVRSQSVTSSLNDLDSLRPLKSKEKWPPKKGTPNSQKTDTQKSGLTSSSRTTQTQSDRTGKRSLIGTKTGRAEEGNRRVPAVKRSKARSLALSRGRDEEDGGGSRKWSRKLTRERKKSRSKSSGGNKSRLNRSLLEKPKMRK